MCVGLGRREVGKARGGGCGYEQFSDRLLGVTTTRVPLISNFQGRTGYHFYQEYGEVFFGRKQAKQEGIATGTAHPIGAWGFLLLAPFRASATLDGLDGLESVASINFYVRCLDDALPTPALFFSLSLYCIFSIVSITAQQQRSIEYCTTVYIKHQSRSKPSAPRLALYEYLTSLVQR